MNAQNRKGLNKWMAIFNEVDAERGKADQDDMNWWRDTSTSLDENVRVRVYDWDADATDTLTMTRRCAIMEGHITPTAEEAELLKVAGVVLPDSTSIAPTPATPAPKVPGVTLEEVIEQLRVLPRFAQHIPRAFVGHPKCARRALLNGVCVVRFP